LWLYGDPSPTEEPFMGSLKNSLRKWCLEEPFFEGSLTHLYRFFEELFKEIVISRTLV